MSRNGKGRPKQIHPTSITSSPPHIQDPIFYPQPHPHPIRHASNMLAQTLIITSLLALTVSAAPVATAPLPVITSPPVRRCNEGESCATKAGGAVTVQPATITVLATVEVECTTSVTVINEKTYTNTVYDTEWRTVTDTEHETVVIWHIQPTPVIYTSLVTAYSTAVFTEVDTKLYTSTIPGSDVTSTMAPTPTSCSTVTPTSTPPCTTSTSTPNQTASVVNESEPAWTHVSATPNQTSSLGAGWLPHTTAAPTATASGCGAHGCNHTVSASDTVITINVTETSAPTSSIVATTSSFTPFSAATGGPALSARAVIAVLGACSCLLLV
jgi:hypothetical protein